MTGKGKMVKAVAKRSDVQQKQQAEDMMMDKDNVRTRDDK
jgi:hypothetical protein